MSYGMVAFPQSLWKKSNYRSRIKYLLYHISIIEEKLNDLRIELSVVIKDLESLTVGNDLTSHLDTIKEEIRYFKSNNPKFEEECASLNTLHINEENHSFTKIDKLNVTLKNLETYRSKLKIDFGDYERIHAMLEYNIRKSMDLQSYVNAKESVEFRDVNISGLRKLVYLYYIYVHPILLKILTFLTAFLSIALLYAEFTNFINFDFSLFNWIFEKDLGYFVTYVLMFFPLVYMLTCTYYGLFSVKLTSWYELYKGHSDPVSMLWSGTIFARLIYPMSYNFITIMKVKNTNYSKVLGILEDFKVLGEGMNRYFFPIVLILFFLMNLFNIWSRLFNA